MTFLEVIKVAKPRVSNISWVSNEHEAKYWWEELEQFILECWDTVNDIYDIEHLRKFVMEVDELTYKYNLGLIAQAMIGATLIRRFIFERHPKVCKRLYEKVKMEELKKIDEWERSWRE